MNQKKQKIVSYWILTGPSILIYASIILFPIIFSTALSFTKWTGFGIPSLVGFANYMRAFKDPVFLHGLRNNLLIVAVSVFGQIPLGFILAYILHRKLVKKGEFFETMIFLPITISAVVVALLWNQIFSPAGLYTGIMRKIMHDPRYVLSIFESRQWAIIPVLFVILWMYTGMYMIMFIANLQKISPSIIESAIIDGATETQVLVHIIIPSMTNILYTTAVFAIAGSLKSFDLVFAMTGGGPAHYTEVIAIYMYLNTFKYYNYGFGSAVSMIIVFLSLGLISFLQKISEFFEKKYE